MLIATVLAAAFGSVFGSVATYLLQRRRDHAEARRGRLAPVFESLFNAIREPDKYSEQWAQSEVGLLVWGSPDLIDAYKEYKLEMGRLRTDTFDGRAALDALEMLLRAMRKEMGHRDSQVTDPRQLVTMLNWTSQDRSADQ